MITCVSIGPGNLDYLTLRAARLLKEADVVAGFTTVVRFAKGACNEEATFITMGYKDQVAKLEEVAALHHAGKQVVVLLMGDVHFSGFQYVLRVEKACGHEVERVPGISSAQILASKARVCFDETTFITLHRRGDLSPYLEHLAVVLKAGRNAIIIPHPWDVMPKDIAAYLLKAGIEGSHPTEVWENLTHGDAPWKGKLSECNQDFSDMSIMLIRSHEPLPTGLEGEAAKP